MLFGKKVSRFGIFSEGKTSSCSHMQPITGNMIKDPEFFFFRFLDFSFLFLFFFFNFSLIFFYNYSSIYPSVLLTSLLRSIYNYLSSKKIMSNYYFFCPKIRCERDFQATRKQRPVQSNSGQPLVNKGPFFFTSWTVSSQR